MMTLIDDLRRLVGDRATDSSSERLCYSRDASQVRGLPDCVVRPLNAIEVSEIVRLAGRLGVPVTPRGAGTGLAGGAVPVSGGILLDLSGMDRILELDLDDLQVQIEPGVIPERLNWALKEHGFFFPPDPGSSAMCTIGGMIANNASGMRCVKYGTTREHVLDLEVVMADGRVIHTGSRMLKSSAGYDLTRLMVGSEGTLGIITAARLKITPLPRARRLIAASFSTAEAGARAVIEAFSAGIVPSACEILDRTTLSVLSRCNPNLALPKEWDLILFEVDGTEQSTAEEAEKIVSACSSAIAVRIASGKEEMEEIWAARRLVGAAVSRLDSTLSRVYLGEDVGVPISQIPALIARVERIAEEAGIPAMKYGHIGDGNLHAALFIDITDEDRWRALERAADRIHLAALDLGGTVSAEHGIGLARARYMERQWGEGLDLMRSIKRALDPQGILNPGKLGL